MAVVSDEAFPSTTPAVSKCPYRDSYYYRNICPTPILIGQGACHQCAIYSFQIPLHPILRQLSFRLYRPVVTSTPATDTTVSSHLGAIIGGAVGVALVGAIIVFWVSLMRRKMGGLIALKKRQRH